MLRSTRRSLRDVHYCERQLSSLSSQFSTLLPPIHPSTPKPLHAMRVSLITSYGNPNQTLWGKNKLSFLYLRSRRAVQLRACWIQMLRNLSLSLKPELCFLLCCLCSLTDSLEVVEKLACMVITAHHLRRGGTYIKS